MDRALALARLHRHEEAQRTLAPELAKLRAAWTKGGGDQILRLDLARALYASALCTPPMAQANLTEALSLLAGMPASLQSFRSVHILRARINEAMRAQPLVTQR